MALGESALAVFGNAPGISMRSLLGARSLTKQNGTNQQNEDEGQRLFKASPAHGDGDFQSGGCSFGRRWRLDHAAQNTQR